MYSIKRSRYILGLKFSFEKNFNINVIAITWKCELYKNWNRISVYIPIILLPRRFAVKRFVTRNAFCVFLNYERDRNNFTCKRVERLGQSACHIYIILLLLWFRKIIISSYFLMWTLIDRNRNEFSRKCKNLKISEHGIVIIYHNFKRQKKKKKL